MRLVTQASDAASFDADRQVTGDVIACQAGETAVQEHGCTKVLTPCQGSKEPPKQSTLTLISLAQVWNEKIQRTPAVIAYASTADQVQQVVKCGRQNNVQVSPRSGGHSYEGKLLQAANDSS